MALKLAESDLPAISRSGAWRDYAINHQSALLIGTSEVSYDQSCPNERGRERRCLSKAACIPPGSNPPEQKKS